MKYDFFLKWELGLAIATAILVVFLEQGATMLADRETLPSWPELQVWLSATALAGARTAISLVLAAMTKGAIQGSRA